MAASAEKRTLGSNTGRTPGGRPRSGPPAPPPGDCAEPNRADPHPTARHDRSIDMKSLRAVRCLFATAVLCLSSPAPGCDPARPRGLERSVEPGLRRQRGRRHESPFYRGTGRASSACCSPDPRRRPRFWTFTRRSSRAVSKGCSASRSIRSTRPTGASSSITHVPATARSSSPSTRFPAIRMSQTRRRPCS